MSLAGIVLVAIASFSSVVTFWRPAPEPSGRSPLCSQRSFAEALSVPGRFGDDHLDGDSGRNYLCLVSTLNLISEVVDAPMNISVQAIYLGAGPTAIAFSLWGYAIRFLPAGVLGSSSLLVPAMVVVVDWLVLGEIPSSLAALGETLCLLGVAFSIIPRMLRSVRKR